jgi:putative PIN family toxin of toxin-antitoxin system
MENSSIRVIIDTNLWVSFLISKNYIELDKILTTDQITLIFSRELLEEFLNVIKRPKLKRFFNNDDVIGILEIIHDVGIFVDVVSEVEVCRDFKDNFLLALAKDSNADYLLTGDKDLLSIGVFEKTRIIAINEFIKTRF